MSRSNISVLLSSFSEDELAKLCRLELCKGEESPVGPYCESHFRDVLSEIDKDKILSMHMSTESKRVLIVLLLIIMLLSTVGNLLVVLTFVINKYMRSVTNVFILSLAVSDLMVTFTCIPIAVGQTVSFYWKYGQFVCKLVPCISHFAVACSSFTLCCIAFDRYYAIVHPLKLKFLQTAQRATILQVIVWLISAGFCIPYAFFYVVKDIAACRINDEEEKLACVAITAVEKTKKVFDVWVTLILLFFGPFLYMTFVYTVICFKLWVQRPIGAATQRNTDSRFRLKRKVIKMLIIVVLVFLVCWSPILLFNAIVEMSHFQASQAIITARAYLQCLSYSSTCWNPIVYAFMNEKFRKAFRTVLFCKKAQVHPTLVRRNTKRLSTESRKTTSQLELPAVPPSANPQTSETKI